MNKNRSVVFGLVFAAVLAAGCRFGLDPAGKVLAGKTQVEFAVTAPFAPLSTDADRAVAPGVNYIYLRTIGGPTGSRGPAYGPYQVAAIPGQAAKLTITDLPAGDYSRLMVLCSTVPLDAETWIWNDTPWLFRDLMRVSDAEFLSLVQGNPGEFSVFDNHIGGRASAGELRSVRLLAGVPLRLQLTLRPVCGEATTAFFVDPGSLTLSSVNEISGEADRLQRRYINFEGLSIPEDKELRALNFMFNLSGDGGVRVHRIAVYDSAGSFLGVQPVGEDVLPGSPTEKYLGFNRPVRGGSRISLYIEYTPQNADDFLHIESGGALLDRPPPSGSVRVSFTGTTAQANTRLFYRIYDGGTIISAGILPLDSTGKGSVLARDLATGTAALFPVGRTYQLEGFIDYGHRLYDKTNAGINAAEAALLAPDAVDHVINHTFTRGATISVPQSISLAASQLSLPFGAFYQYVYVAQSALGSADGLSPENAMDLVSGIATANASTPVPGQYFAVILVGNVQITGLTTFTVQKPIIIMGAFDGRTIIFEGLEGSYFGNLFYINNAELVLTRISVNAPHPQDHSAFSLSGASKLVLGPRSFLSKLHSTVEGGAINSWGTVVLNGGKISYCSAPRGGAIWAGAGTIELHHGIINNCFSTGTGSTDGGGALYLQDWTTLAITARAPVQIYSNTSATKGGAVYQTGSTTAITVNTTNKVVYDNHAAEPSGGGGWYLNGSYTVNGFLNEVAPLASISQNNTSGTPAVTDNVRTP